MEDIQITTIDNRHVLISHLYSYPCVHLHFPVYHSLSSIRDNPISVSKEKHPNATIDSITRFSNNLKSKLMMFIISP